MQWRPKHLRRPGPSNSKARMPPTLLDSRAHMTKMLRKRPAGRDAISLRAKGNSRTCCIGCRTEDEMPVRPLPAARSTTERVAVIFALRATRACIRLTISIIGGAHSASVNWNGDASGKRNRRRRP